MEWFQHLMSNKILLAAACGWLTAQVLKTIIYGLTHRGNMDWSRLVGDGGMPSGHSATVSALAVECALTQGLASPSFAIAFFLAIIVMHDAMGVRQETGKQSKALNELMGIVYKKDLSNQEKLKEFVGHTPSQVLAGSLLGIAIAFLFYFL